MDPRGVCQELIKCHARLQELLEGGTIVVNRDDALALANLLATMCDTSLELAKRARTCPGRYWRSFDAAREAIVAYNSNSRKRQKVDASSACCGKDGNPSFDKCYVGPPPTEQGGSRHICDACGSALNRDKEKKFL